MPYRIHTKKTWYETYAELEEMFAKWGVVDYGIAGNPAARGAVDRSVTVRFMHRSGREVAVKKGDQERPVDNLRALYLALEDMRMLEVRGLGDVVGHAYLQLEAPKLKRDPYEVLGVRSDAPKSVIDAAYRARAKEVHSDMGNGSDDSFKDLQDAYERIGR